VLNEALGSFIATLDRYTLADVVLTKRDFERPRTPTRTTRGPRIATVKKAAKV